MTLQEYLNKDWNEIIGFYGYYVLPVILTACALLMLRRLSSSNLNLPPGPMGLPIVGYLPFLGKEPYKTLDRLRWKYGNIFSLNLGQMFVVILGDYPTVKDAFSKSSTSDRPPRLFDIIPDGGGVAGANGEEWVAQRRLFVRSMKDIGLGRSSWSSLVEEEVSECLEVLASKEGHPVDIVDIMTTTLTNNISSLIFGKRLPPGPDRDLMYSSLDAVTRIFSSSDLRNFFPLLCDILLKLKITSYYKIHRELTAFNSVVKKEIEQINSKKGAEGQSSEFNFVSEYVKAMHANQGKIKDFTESNLIANTRALFIAASETTRTSLLWLFLAMAAYPDVQEKVRLELESVLGKRQRASWEDRLRFPYTYSVIMETQRWKTVVPLNVLRMASEDTNVCGYDIPKGAIIIANIWGVHHDSRYWQQPEKYIPERFKQNGVNEVDLKKESYAPFSLGKRKCPGEIVAMMEIFLYFTAIIQLFEVRVPNGGKPNMAGNLGATYQPISQKLCFVPRQENSKNA